MKIHLNPKMNSKIADIMRVSKQPAQMYGAALIDAYRASGLEPDEIPHWIPCSERLPEEAYGCLLIVEEDDYFNEPQKVLLPYFAGYDGTQWNDGDGQQIPFEVIYWQPLPQPPKEEK